MEFNWVWNIFHLVVYSNRFYTRKIFPISGLRVLGKVLGPGTLTFLKQRYFLNRWHSLIHEIIRYDDQGLHSQLMRQLAWISDPTLGTISLKTENDLVCHLWAIWIGTATWGRLRDHDQRRVLRCLVQIRCCIMNTLSTTNFYQNSRTPLSIAKSTTRAIVLQQ